MNGDQSYAFEAELWRYNATRAPWHFVTVPVEICQQIRFFSGKTTGFGSIRVEARIGESRWATSLFPDKASGCFFLPVKAQVRRAQTISAGDRVNVELLIT